MRKNKTMGIAAALLVATLLTTSMISGTFAKYTSTGTGSDSARVAKWGVTVTANGETFADTYATDDSSVKGIIVNSVIGTGSQDGKAKVVAPGTQGNLMNATIFGTPEVAVHVAYEPTLTLTGWKLENNTEYCPIVFTIGSKTYGLTGMKDAEGITVTNESTSISDLQTAVEGAIKAYSKVYAPNTDLSNIANEAGYVQVSWNWAFDNNDVNDTYLGKLAADDNANNDSKVELSITTTVTQID